MRHRRKSKATWFPIVPSVYVEGVPGTTWYEKDLSFSGTALAGDTQIYSVPLTLDDTISPDTEDAGASLRDVVEGQDYLLQRVVGKVWGGINYTGDDDDPSLREGILCIALAVLPTLSQTAQPDLDPEEWNPLLARNAQMPWIWRRTWRLDNPYIWSSTPYTLPNPPPGYPGHTSDYSGLEGGHLDSKVKRRITREHRLYIIAAMGALQVGGDSPGGMDPTEWNFGYDLRVLGTMRRGRNKSSF